MNNTAISPASPDDNTQNEKDPTQRANDKRGYECESIQQDSALDPAESQSTESDLNLVEFEASTLEPSDGCEDLDDPASEAALGAHAWREPSGQDSNPLSHNEPPTIDIEASVIKESTDDLSSVEETTIPSDLTDSGITLTGFAEASPEPLDPEDLTSYAITDDPEQAFTKKALTTVPVRKPTKEPFIRTLHQEGGWNIYPLLELKEEGKTYLLSPPIAAALEAEVESTLIKARLVPAVDRQGNVFLWPLKVSDRECDWHISAYRAAILAKDKWIRMKSNMAAGVYDTLIAVAQDAEPQWPEEDFATLLRIAFEGRVITQWDHPVLKDLRGE